MTTEQSMLIRRGLALLGAALLAGCAGSRESLKAPSVLSSPYQTGPGVLWAVAPFRNESGTTSADALAISDKIVGAAAQVRGLRVLPLNRTLEAMRSLNMRSVESPADARRLAGELGADGVIVGSITAYDPYNPPQIGFSLALLVRPGAAAGNEIDPVELQMQPTDHGQERSSFGDRPASVITTFLDGKNHQVQMDLMAYSEGRSGDRSALGWRRYLSSMDLFTEFAAWNAVSRLIDEEWIRVARVETRRVN